MLEFHLWCYHSLYLNMLHSFSFSRLFHWEPWLSFCLLYTSGYFFTNSFLFTHFVDPCFSSKKSLFQIDVKLWSTKLKRCVNLKWCFQRKVCHSRLCSELVSYREDNLINEQEVHVCLGKETMFSYWFKVSVFLEVLKNLGIGNLSFYTLYRYCLDVIPEPLVTVLCTSSDWFILNR